MITVRAPWTSNPVAVRRFVGGFFLVTGGVHIGIVAADTSFYRPFADGALPAVRTAWGEVFMAHPAAWGLAVAAGEIALGLCLLGRDRAVAVGWAGVVAFHLALLLAGWGFWMWSIPVLAVLVPAALADRRAGFPDPVTHPAVSRPSAPPTADGPSGSARHDHVSPHGAPLPGGGS